jgi:hypothetical protein
LLGSCLSSHTLLLGLLDGGLGSGLLLGGLLLGSNALLLGGLLLGSGLLLGGLLLGSNALLLGGLLLGSGLLLGGLLLGSGLLLGGLLLSSSLLLSNPLGFGFGFGPLLGSLVESGGIRVWGLRVWGLGFRASPPPSFAPFLGQPAIHGEIAAACALRRLRLRFSAFRVIFCNV